MSYEQRHARDMRGRPRVIGRRSVPLTSVLRFILTSAMAVVLVGCGSDALDPARVGTMRLYRSRDQEQMMAALSDARIPFEVRKDAGGNEEIWYDSTLQERVLSIRDELFGAPPPIGRNIALGSEGAAVFAEEMNRRGATFRTGIYHETQYVAWEPESDAAADAALKAACVSAEMLAEMNRLRRLADAERSDRTDPSSRSREDRAPTER